MTLKERLSPVVVDAVGVRMARAIGFVKPGLQTRTISELSSMNREEAAKLAGTFSVHLMDAAVCIEDHVFSTRDNPTCPRCGTTVWMYLTDLKVYPVNKTDLWDEEKRLRRDAPPS